MSASQKRSTRRRKLGKMIKRPRFTFTKVRDKPANAGRFLNADGGFIL